MDACSELPPIGSLWLHRESGERRFVLYLGGASIAYFAVDSHGKAPLNENQISHADWLAWQAKAVRIDNTPQRGREETE